jgi:hypothetical protein
MQPGWLVAIEVLLVLALVLGFGFRELWALKRDRQRDAASRQGSEDRGPSDGPPANPSA